jgi:hypothetical protein
VILRRNAVDERDEQAMGCSTGRHAVETASPSARAPSKLTTMADARHIAVAAEHSPDAPTAPEMGVALTQADFDALVRELESLRHRH